MRKPKLKLKSRGLKQQLLSRFFLILVILLLILELCQYISIKRYLCSSKEQELALEFHNEDMKTLMNIRTKNDLLENEAYILGKILDVNINVALIDGDGNILGSNIDKKSNSIYFSKDPHDDGKKVPVIFGIPKLSASQYSQILHKSGNLERSYKLIKDDNGNWQVVTWRKVGGINSPVALLQLSTSADSIVQILHQQIYLFVIASIIILIIGWVLGRTVFESTLRPLYKMTNTIEEINVEQLHTRLPVDNKQLEVDRLSTAFNEMLQRIEISFEKEQYIKEKMRQFVSDASHELRTPLTSIHGFVEVLLRGAAKNEKQLDLALNSILMESERLTKLVNDLLLLTKLDQQLPAEMKIENLKDIIDEIYPQLKILTSERILEVKVNENLCIQANRNQIKQIFFNLVQNAVHHTDEKQGIIKISGEATKEAKDEYALLKIEDNGTGIPEEHLGDIFGRFFRSEAHRARKHGGYGLGLSIVKSIIDAHDGKIRVESKLGTGTTFLVYLKSVKEK